ncbi:MAG: type IV pilus twitching motility protein PilT [Deltaproteobacteria bacterium]|nr:type IV pilus twitching motility protein PilT [Deltaproteobacteria bacterium]
MDTAIKLVESAPPTSERETPAIQSLIRALVKHGASDLHLKEGRPPLYRINGKLVPAKAPPFTNEKVKALLYGIMNPRLIERFEKNLQVDFSFVMGQCGRFRVCVYLQRETIAGAIRMIPVNIPSLDSLGLPPVLKEIALARGGLVLVTGATGSGKSTTLAAMVDHINRNRHNHIVTIEDPIEFVHRDVKSGISQREIGTDARTVQDALVGALRQDPDVIAIGEVRDYEAIGAALTAAETGHLVLTTLHTIDARSSIDRIVDVFPPVAKDQARVQLSSSLTAVVSQRLINKADGSGRMAVCELMMNSPTIRTLIRNNQLDKIDEAIMASNAYYNMQTFNQALERLVASNTITADEAILASNSPEDLRMRLAGFKKEEGY